MDHKYILNDITLDAVPDLQDVSTLAGETVGTLGGGALTWQGGFRGHIKLHGDGLLESERAALASALAAGSPVTLQTFEQSWQVVLTSLRVEPLDGTTRFRYALELIVVG